MDLLTANNIWMMICTALVFFMHLGFSLLEVGLTRQKNAINILFKNILLGLPGSKEDFTAEKILSLLDDYKNNNIKL